MKTQFLPLAVASLLGLSACMHERMVPPSNQPPAPSWDSRLRWVPPLDDGGRTSGSHALSISLPPGYDAGDRRYAVIYILDGEVAFTGGRRGRGDTIGFDLAHDQLVFDGLIEPAILVAVHNSCDARGAMIPGNRAIDYTPKGQTSRLKDPPPARLEDFHLFLTEVVKPLIDRTYRTRPEAAATGVAGFSRAGLAAFWLTHEHPETFGLGCAMSPALWNAKEYLQGLADPRGPKPPVRLWIDIGSREYETWGGTYSRDASRLLVARGFRQNEDLAYQVGHDQGHNHLGCSQRARAALYFLLRTRPPALTGVEIVDSHSRTGGAICLARPGYATLETIYDGWFRLADCTAEFSVADPAIVALAGGSGGLRPVSAGKTTLATTYAGQPMMQSLQVPVPPPPLPCRALAHPVAVDGALSDWPELPYRVETLPDEGDTTVWRGPADLSYRFGCAFDDRFFYLAVEVTDDRLVSEPGKAPWQQDGVEIRIDARPESERLLAQGNESADILLLAMSPGPAGELRPPHDAARLPTGTVTRCVTTLTGHCAEIAVPIAYLDASAGRPWTAVRVNVVVNDADREPSDSVTKFWWQGDWRSPANVWGSGTFAR